MVMAQCGYATIRDVQASHVDANAPAAESFDRLLRRDIENYFRKNTGVVGVVSYELLRKRPSRGGVAYQKFYLWVSARSDASGGAIDGAMRAAAVEKSGFIITDFITVNDIIRDPRRVYDTFPRILCPAIIERAKKKAQSRAPDK